MLRRLTSVTLAPTAIGRLRGEMSRTRRGARACAAASTATPRDPRSRPLAVGRDPLRDRQSHAAPRPNANGCLIDAPDGGSVAVNDITCQTHAGYALRPTAPRVASR